MPDDYYKGVGTLAPTDGIKDPQVRAFCDSLANVWQLRNGNSGSDDKQRFITKEEWDFIAKNPNIRALAGIGQPGSSSFEPGPGDSGGGGQPQVPDWIQNLVDFLAAGITLIDFTEVYKRMNTLFADSYALTTEIRNAIKNVDAQIAALEDGITQINTVDGSDTTSPNAQMLTALKLHVDDPATGLEKAHAYIADIENVAIDSKSANASHTALLEASFTNVNNNNLKNTADIIQINTVSADSTSASAKQLNGLSVNVGYNPATGQSKVVGDIAQLNFLDANSASINAKTVFTMSGQVNGYRGEIDEINNVVVDSTSASASKLAGVMVMAGFKAKVFAQAGAPELITPPNAGPGVPTYTLKPGDLWIDTANNNIMFIWNGTAWQDASDKRITTGGSSGILTEQTARINSDNALAHQLNIVWAEFGGSQNLVSEGSDVVANPYYGTATKFNQVQSMVTVPGSVPPRLYQAASKDEFKAYTDLNNAKAGASYVLQVEAKAGGINAVAGMTLFSEVDASQVPPQPKSAVIFLANDFLIYNDNTHVTTPPFFVSNNQVRMNTVYINDRIQSDSWVTKQSGWIIRRDGSAEFNGTSFFGSLYTGTKYIDRDSTFPIYSTAIAAWSQGPAINNPSNTFIFQNGANAMFGPNGHNQAPQVYQRIRASRGTPMAAWVQFIGVADHYVTIWMNYNSQGWQPLMTTATPSSGYGAVTCAWAGTLNCDLFGYYNFGVTPTDASYGMFNNGARNLSDFTFTVTIVNL